MARSRDERGVSPVVGATLLVGIVVVLAGITTAVFLDLGREREPSPDVVFETDPAQGAGMVLVHRGGTVLDASNVELRGVARPHGLGGEFASGDDHHVFPTDERVQVVWYGERTSYVIWETSVPPGDRVPEPDEDCEWVETQTNNGSDPIDVDGIVVACDVTTNGDVDVVNGAAIVGTAESTFKNIDIDESAVYGPVDADGDVDLDGSNVTGSIASTGNDITITDGSTVEGDITITGGNVDIDGGSTVEGAVVANGTVDLDDVTVSGDVVSYDSTVELDGVTVSGDVFVDPGGLTECSAGSTIGGEPCSSYTPRDPDDY